jgi:thiol-disulfide isomerase/thioredoxin
MRKVLFFCLFSLAVSAQTVPVKLTVAILNPNSDSLVVFDENKSFQKVLHSENGKFKANFDLEPGIYYTDDGTEWAVLYFQKGFDLTMTVDAKQFDETLQFTGKGEKENNFLAAKTLSEETFNMQQAKFQPTNDYAGFEKLRNEFTAASATKLQSGQFDASFVAYVKESEKGMLGVLDQMYEKMKNATNIKGAKSSSFAYENFNGSVSRLEDFKGKYLYIDVWATWCGPCRQEIPFLKQVEEKYHGKNIVFMSISIDAPNDHDKWKKFVAEKNLGGVQLFADKASESDFIQAYGIASIPRFILIDPNGVIVESEAGRPSNPDLQKQLDSLLR